MAFPLSQASRMLVVGCSNCLPRLGRLAPSTTHAATRANLTFNLQTRNYAKKHKASRKDDDDEGTVVLKTKGKQFKKSSSSVSLSSGSSKAGEEPPEASESATEELEKNLLDKAAVRMDRAVERFQGQAYDGVERGKGRITPALLDSVRVQLVPEEPLEPLQSVASVTVRNATLFVEVYDQDSMKIVETAIHKANLPGISPQKHDSRTLKIPISRPTQEVRAAILKDLHTLSETAKQQIRGARTDALKGFTHKIGKGGEKGTPFAKDIQDVTDKHTGRLDGLMTQVKKEFAKV